MNISRCDQRKKIAEKLISLFDYYDDIKFVINSMLQCNYVLFHIPQPAHFKIENEIRLKFSVGVWSPSYVPGYY